MVLVISAGKHGTGIARGKAWCSWWVWALDGEWRAGNIHLLTNVETFSWRLKPSKTNISKWVTESEVCKNGTKDCAENLLRWFSDRLDLTVFLRNKKLNGYFTAHLKTYLTHSNDNTQDLHSHLSGLPWWLLFLTLNRRCLFLLYTFPTRFVPEVTTGERKTFLLPTCWKKVKNTDKS